LVLAWVADAVAALVAIPTVHRTAAVIGLLCRAKAIATDADVVGAYAEFVLADVPARARITVVARLTVSGLMLAAEPLGA